jgi:hypothetical protein
MNEKPQYTIINLLILANIYDIRFECRSVRVFGRNKINRFYYSNEPNFYDNLNEIYHSNYYIITYYKFYHQYLYILT